MERRSCWHAVVLRAIARCEAETGIPRLGLADDSRLARYVGPRTEHLELIAPGLKYNTGFGLKMGLEVGAATAGSMNGMHVSGPLGHVLIPNRLHRLTSGSASLLISEQRSQMPLSGATVLALS